MTGKKTVAVVAVDLVDDPHIGIVYDSTDINERKADYDYEVSLLTTDCNFGGVRYWFCCPSCGMRLGGLYLVPGDFYFRCRHCNNLSYRSRNGSRLELWGHTSRQIEALQKQIKRWTYKGKLTIKVQRLHVLEQKMARLSP